MGCYSRLMVRHPLVLILIDVVLAFVLGPLTVWIFGLPDFSDPIKGFEPRGSEISIRENVATLVYKAINNKELHEYPGNSSLYNSTLYDPNMYNNSTWPPEPSPTHSRKKRFTADTDAQLQKCVYEALYKMINSGRGSPRIVVTSKTGENIFTAEHMHSICRLQETIAKYHWSQKNECFLVSLPLYVTVLVQKTSCYDITQDDMDKVMDYLKDCAEFYFNGMLTPYCNETTCPLVRSNCRYFQAVYTIMHILTDTGFMANQDTSKTDVKFSLIGLQTDWYADREELVDFYLSTLDNKILESGDIHAPAMSLGIELQLFNTYIVGDAPWYILAMCMVVVVLLVYLQSFVLMVAVVTNVAITLCLSYFIYYYICQIHFFPFMNLIAALLLIAIGADDVFILYDLWRQQLQQFPDDSYEEIMSETLRKGGMSIFVTSLTTAAALLANLVSEVTTIRCFGIFAGICMLVNFVLMITWIPALIILIEKSFNYCISDRSCKKARSRSKKLSDLSEYFWSVIVMKIITAGAPFWIVSHLALGLLGLIAVFLKPGLKLPETSEVKIFSTDHPFELYLNTYRHQIRFEIQAQNQTIVELMYIWGVKSEDNGNYFDPEDRGHLVFYPLDIYNEEAISWMNGFCHRLKVQSFMSNRDKDKDCYFEVIEQLMVGPCNTSDGYYDLRPCCELTKPIDPSIVESCIGHLTHISKGKIHKITGKGIIGEVIFDSNQNIVIFRYDFESNRMWLANYAYNDDLVKEVDAFQMREMHKAPGRLKDGWYTTLHGFKWRFYNLQSKLSSGTIVGIGISLAMGFMVLLFTSLNIVISMFAIFTISMVIGTTVGTLVMLGWVLNVTESVTIILSLGLAVDFTIHYGMAYKLSDGETRSDRVKDVVKSVCSAVSMAAFTTFISGISVLPGRVLAYRQFGIFLIFVMIYSWIYSTFFFLSLCYMMGPIGYIGDLRHIFCRKDKKQEETTSGVHGPQTHSIHGDRAMWPPNSRSSLQHAMFSNKPSSNRVRPSHAHGSVDSKLMSSPEMNISGHNLPHESVGYEVGKPVAVRIPDLRGHRSSGPGSSTSLASDNEGKPRRGRRTDDSSTSSESLSSSGGPSKTYVYNVHVYCVGDIKDAERLHREAKKKRKARSSEEKRNARSSEEKRNARSSDQRRRARSSDETTFR